MKHNLAKKFRVLLIESQCILSPNDTGGINVTLQTSKVTFLNISCKARKTMFFYSLKKQRELWHYCKNMCVICKSNINFSYQQLHKNEEKYWYNQNLQNT